MSPGVRGNGEIGEAKRAGCGRAARPGVFVLKITAGLNGHDARRQRRDAENGEFRQVLL